MPSCKVAVATLIGLVGAAAALAALTWTAGPAPEAMLARDYGAAFARADRSWSTLPSNVWLSGLQGGPTVDKGLSPGDTITIAAKDGRPQQVEVTELEHIDGTRLGMPGVRFQLVTGRSSSGGGTVRFIFAAHEAAPAVMPSQGGSTL